MNETMKTPTDATLTETLEAMLKDDIQSIRTRIMVYKKDLTVEVHITEINGVSVFEEERNPG